MNNFFVIFDWMIDDLKLSGTERDIYAMLYNFTQNGMVYTGQTQWFADFLKISKDEVQNTFEKLISKNLVERIVISNDIKKKICGYKIIPHCHKEKILSEENEEENFKTAKTIVKNLFHNESLDLSDNFYEELYKNIAAKKLSEKDIGGYLKYCHNYAVEKSKNGSSIDYFYRTAAKDYMIIKWKNDINPKTDICEPVIQKLHCPGCHSILANYSDCNNCHLPYNSFQNEEEIVLFKKIFNLEQSQKNQIYQELDFLHRDAGFDFNKIKNIKIEKQKILEKYGL